MIIHVYKNIYTADKKCFELTIVSSSQKWHGTSSKEKMLHYTKRQKGFKLRQSSKAHTGNYFFNEINLWFFELQIESIECMYKITQFLQVWTVYNKINGYFRFSHLFCTKLPQILSRIFIKDMR